MSVLDPNINLPNPVPGDNGLPYNPNWASELQAFLTKLAAMTHTGTPTDGIQIPSAGLNINEDLSFNSLYNLINTRSVSFASQSSPLSNPGDICCLYFDGVNFWCNNGAGQQIQITAGGGINSAGIVNNNFPTTTVNSTPFYMSGTDTYALMQVNTANARTINLASANSFYAGRFFIIKDVSGTAATHNITINTYSGDTISGNTNFVINTNYGYVIIASDGISTWAVLGQDKLLGDVTGNQNATVVSKIQGVTISGTPAAGYFLEATSSTAASWQAPSGVTLIGDVTGIATANILSAIDGYTLPNPGDHTGVLQSSGSALTWTTTPTLGAITVTGLTDNTLGTGIVHSGSGGAFTSSFVVDADVSSGAAVAVSKLAAGTANQILINNATPTPTWTTLSGDATNALGVITVGKINSASVPAAGSLTTGNVLQVNGVSSLTYAALNLAGGANYITGNLPVTNVAYGTANQILVTNAGATASAWATTLPGNYAFSGTPTFSNTLALNTTGTSGGLTGSPSITVSGITDNTLVTGIVHSTGSVSIFPTTATPVGSSSSSSIFTLGVKVQSSQVGYITGVRFYKIDSSNTTHTVNLWDHSGTLLATATSTSESSSGWQQVSFATAVAISANTTYIAAYLMPGGNFPIDLSGLTSAVVNSPLEALADGQDGVNGVYSSGNTFPSNGDDAANYWVDVVFSLSGGSGGVFTSSLVVNADIAASGTANIAVNKLAAGTSAQFLLNNATPTATWTSMSGDVTLSATGATTVGKIDGYTLPNPGNNIGVLQSSGTALSWSTTPSLGNITVYGLTDSSLGTGIVHSGSGGAFTSSLLINADIAASGTANIAVNKLAAGTSAQILLNNATPTATWTSMSGDITLSATGATTVAAIDGYTVATPVGGTNGQVLGIAAGNNLTWQTVGGAVTWASDLSGNSTSTSSNQYVSSLSYSSAAGGGAIAINGTGTSLAWALGNTGPSIIQTAPAVVSSGTGTAGSNMAITAQAGGADTGSSVTAGAGGKLTLNAGVGGSASAGTNSSGGAGANIVINAGAGGAKSGSGTVGNPGLIDLQVAANSRVQISDNSTATTVSLSDTGQTYTLSQAALASTSGGSGSAGVNFTLQAQDGQAATGSSHNGGNGANLVLTAGLGGTSGSATQGKGGVIAFTGGQTVTVVTKTSAYTIDSLTTSDDTIFITGSTTVTLPVPTAGRKLKFKDSLGNAAAQNKTIHQNASEKIDGANTYVLTSNYACIELTSDGTNWFVTGEYNGTII